MLFFLLLLLPSFQTQKENIFLAPPPSEREKAARSSVDRGMKCMSVFLPFDSLI